MKRFFEDLVSGISGTKKTNAKGENRAQKANAKNVGKGVGRVKSSLKTQSKISNRKLNVKSKLGKNVKSGPIRRMKSTESVFNISKHQTNTQFGSRLTPMNGFPAGHTLFDVCAYVIHCPKHNNMALSKEEKKAYIWLPFISLPPSRTWTESAIDGAYIVLSGGDAPTYLALRSTQLIAESFCMQLFRLQLPQTQKFNVRLIYYIKLSEVSRGAFNCCTDTNRLEWKSYDDVVNSSISKLWGPEVIDFSRRVSEPIQHNIHEYSLDDAFTYVPRDPPRNLEEEMLKSTEFTEKDIERVYIDFVEHCFPAFFMTQTSFNDYMSKYGFERMDKKLEHLFRAFNFNKNSFLGFHELLLGLTSIDPMTQNGQSRIKFVFKYFDADSDGVLNEKEFTLLVKEIYPEDSESVVKKKVKESMKIIGIKSLSKGVGVPFENFFKAVGAHRFRGTSSVCRSNEPVLAQISRAMATRTIKKFEKLQNNVSLGPILNNRKYKGICKSCKEKNYEFAFHLVLLNEEGMCASAQPLPEWHQIERTTAVSDSLVQKTKSYDSLVQKTKSDESGSSLGSSGSLTTITIDTFSAEYVWNPKSVANYFIQEIRSFNTKKGLHKEKKGLFDGPQEREGFVKKLEELCSVMEKLVVQDDRCAKVSSPAFIIGDIHGNLEDLMTLESVLWKGMPIVSANYVFLGDYVDRGMWGLECAIYIMCLKLLAPNKVVMLRGNHEVRELQKTYTYYKECVHKYGNTLGPKVFEITNSVFDKLPFCAVIDDAIYCAHGGIPYTARHIAKINEVKSDIKDPERESAIAWEILWSDPIGPQQFAETAELLQVRVDSTRGFLVNNKRGTAFLFGEEAANTFLENNGLTHIVRAHEVPAEGFSFLFGKKCTTVFSSSHYCGNNNDAACIHVDNEKLRIVRLDTVNNAPACD